MCERKLFSMVNKLILDVPGEWTMTYVVGNTLKISRLSEPLARVCNGDGIFQYSSLDATVKNKLRTVLGLILEYHSNPQTSGGFVLHDYRNRRKVIVEYNNSIAQMSDQTNTADSIDYIFRIAFEIVTQFLYDDEFGDNTSGKKS